VTLRSRLVAALLVLSTVGLGAFGVVTYRLYERSQYHRLDEQLRSTPPLVTSLLYEEAGLADPDPSTGEATDDGGDRPLPPVVLPAGTYAELRTADGDATTLTLGETTAAEPDLDGVAPGAEAISVGSTSGATQWRVIAVELRDDNTVVVATPTTEVERSLDRLVLIEGAAGAALLVLLGTGSWLILRRGLQPLERMAVTAGSIRAGDLSHRVDAADGRGEVGELGLALNTMLDDLERAFAERDATAQRLRQFLADASHELRTPLTSIRGFAELFRLGDEQVDLPVVLRRIEEQSARMKDLVDELLLLAGLDQPRPLDTVPVDLVVLAADACSDAVALDHARTVTLDAPAPVVVSGVRDHLQQAVANLVVNAVQHTPGGTPIEISARSTGGWAALTVRDRGPGLTPDALDHAFDRFWRADNARAGTGSGLGLAIVAAIAEEHGGTAEAGNRQECGARFTLRIPLGPADRPPL
jgi:two-component system OmpR family sensor kinase